MFINASCILCTKRQNKERQLVLFILIAVMEKSGKQPMMLREFSRNSTWVNRLTNLKCPFDSFFCKIAQSFEFRSVRVPITSPREANYARIISILVKYLFFFFASFFVFLGIHSPFAISSAAKLSLRIATFLCQSTYNIIHGFGSVFFLFTSHSAWHGRTDFYLVAQCVFMKLVARVAA